MQNTWTLTLSDLPLSATHILFISAHCNNSRCDWSILRTFKNVFKIWFFFFFHDHDLSAVIRIACSKQLLCNRYCYSEEIGKMKIVTVNQSKIIMKKQKYFIILPTKLTICDMYMFFIRKDIYLLITNYECILHLLYPLYFSLAPSIYYCCSYFACSVSTIFKQKKLFVYRLSVYSICVVVHAIANNNNQW